MKTRKIILTLPFFIPPLIAQNLVINSGASLYIPSGADICAGIYGNISGNIYGEGTQCGLLPVPVELQSFSVAIKNNLMLLNWKTATEVNNYGFGIERMVNEGAWEKIGFVHGNGNSASPKSYEFTDNNPIGGSKFVYRLKQIDTDGAYEYSTEVKVELLPTKYELFQNYPNPFNPVTNFKFSLPAQTKLKIKLYNMLSEQVATIAQGTYESGYHLVIFNANNLPSGTYLYRLESSEFVQVKKMLLIK